MSEARNEKSVGLRNDNSSDDRGISSNAIGNIQPATVTTPSAFGGTKRGVAPTRTTTGWAKGSTEHPPPRSHTLPMPSRVVEQETPPTIPEKKNDLAGSGYEVEQLSDLALRDERDNSRQYLSPSMPVPDARKSGSSFQTEPSSYYSADDNFSSYGPPPPMPIPDPVRKDTVERLYDSIWEAAQLSTTPPADEFPMPSPSYGGAGGEQDYSTSYYNPDSQWAPHQRLGLPADDQLHGDLQSYMHNTPDKMPSALQGMPHENISSSSGADSLHTSDHSRHGFPEPQRMPPATNPNAIPVAPLRIHHGAPTSVSPVFEHHRANSDNVQMPTAATSNLTQRPIHGRNDHEPGTATRPPGPTPQFNAFYAPAANTTRPEARPSALSSATPSGVRPSRTDSHGVAQPPAGAAGSAFSSSVSSRPNVSQSHVRPQGAPGDSHGVAQPPAGAAGSAFSSSVSSRPNVPQSHLRPQGAPGGTVNSLKPAGTTTFESQNANNAPQKPASTNIPQANFDVRPQTASAPPKKTNVTIIPQQPMKRPQNTGMSTPNVHQENIRPSQSTNGPPKASNIHTRPQVTETIRPQATHASTTTSAAAVSRPQQQPISHKPEVVHKPEPAPKPTPPTEVKPAKMTGATPTRRHGELSQMDTQYVNMMLALDDIPVIHNIAAGFFNWILLAGFILFPGTFTSLQNLDVPPADVSARLIKVVTNLPLYIVAWVCCGFGAAGMCWLWWRWRKNYLWAVNKIFLPGLLNSLAGFISTIANIYGVQHGEYSSAGKSTIVVTAASIIIFGVLFLFYTFWLIRNVKKRHDAQVGKQRTGKHGEGIADLTKKRKL